MLSVLRLAIIPLFIITLINGQPGRALTLFAIAGFTDLLDGIIARVYRQQSVLGAYLDPGADKFLMTASFIILAIPGLHPGLTVPVWMTVLVITRDVIIVGVALIIYLALGFSGFSPTLTSKWNTGFQIASVVAVLLTGVWRIQGFAGAAFLDTLTWITLYVMIALTVVSGLEYGYRYIYRAEELTPTDSPPESS